MAVPWCMITIHLMRMKGKATKSYSGITGLNQECPESSWAASPFRQRPWEEWGQSQL